MQTVGHILGTGPLLAAVVEPIKHVQDRLRVLLLLLLANVGVLQHERPLLWHALENVTKKERGFHLGSVFLFW